MERRGTDGSPRAASSFRPRTHQIQRPLALQDRLGPLDGEMFDDGGVESGLLVGGDEVDAVV